MKKRKSVLRSGICALCVLAALAFAGIEGWLLVSGDWLLFENRVLALVQICLRLSLALLACGVGLKAMSCKDRSFLWQGLTLLAASLAAAPFLSNYVGWGLAALSALFVLSQWLGSDEKQTAFIWKSEKYQEEL